MENKPIFMAFVSIMVLLSFSSPTLAIEHDEDKPLLNSDKEFDAAMANSPSSCDYNRDMIESQSKKHLDYLINCGEKMGPDSVKCNIEVRAEILRNKEASKDCCQMIVKAGKECHIEWMKLFFQTYQLKRFSSKRIFKTNEIWNRCSNEVGSI
ncbi:hypothetical protein EUTSA_v10000516mg [Eutrema salsugineum]|uniref:Prolamin-like domain-containing protein n=1 Tax=Eutrema salsugineum TaxID=72664 RepID=V4LS70_EUTSA|nr:protein DOWN-REGULATED IN DIF1 11 [Eutrema salsugineum]ESQ46644.1 hypothetical protein EUTSA_v10000516mg [Eutrema salsugineum]